MRIAQVAPLYESVPPKLYGGTERVVSYLTEALVEEGHEVTLFASGDSVTKARLVGGSAASLRLNPRCTDSLAHHIALLQEVYRQAALFDIIHFHVDYLHYPMTTSLGLAAVTTLHGRLDLPDLLPIYREFPHVPVVSISDSQRSPLPDLNWRGTVHHGLPLDLYRCHGTTGDYLAFLGRISPEKGVARAIEIAKRFGMKLKIAAKIDKSDQRYFEQEIGPLLSADADVDFIGEIGESEKNDFLGKAYALLFPIEWPEPFGLVMIEAMACGTPIVAFDRGSVPEVLVPGITGFIVDNTDDAVRALHRVRRLSRHRCRRHFEERYSSIRNAREYVRIYESLIEQGGRHGIELPQPTYGILRPLATHRVPSPLYSPSQLGSVSNCIKTNRR